MDARVDPYAILGISPDSEDVVIRAAYRALKEKYSRGIRPDAWDKQRARDIDAAYAVLRDPASRRAHDRRQDGIPRPEIAAPAAAVAAPRPSPPPPPRAPAAPVGRGSGGRTAAIALAAVGLALVGWLATHRRPAQSVSGTPRGLTIRKRYPTTSVRLVRPLPCYVNGQPVGQLLLRDCASRNGVATGPLDVALAAAAPPATLPHPAAVSAAAPSPTPEPPVERPSPPPRPTFVTPPQASAEARSPSPPRPARRPTFAPPPQLFADAGPPPPERMAERPGFGRMRPNAAPYAEAKPYPPNAPAETMGVVRAFYAALGEGDGDRAAALVTPEKRGGGPLSAPAMTRFYSSLRRPLRLMQIYPLDDSTVFARYRFVTADGRRCFGAANVTTTQRGGVMLVRGIRAYNGC